MKKTFVLTLGLAAALLAGCQSIPPGAERGPHRTMAYQILIEASEPGARIEANGEYMGNAPLNLKVFGDPDGTFHDFGSPYFTVHALPLTTNQFVQTRFFRTGQAFMPEDKIPQHLYFDMNQNTPPPPAYPLAGPPVYYDPYPAPYYYGPGVRFYFGPRYYHRHW